MKPFDLTRALAGDPVVTRDGRQVTELHHFKTANNTHYPIGAVLDGATYIFTIDGKDYRTNESRLDLFMAPKKRMIWVNLYPTSDRLDFWHDSEASANAAATVKGIRLGNRAYPVEIEE